MELRWLILSNPTTAEEVERYARVYGMSQRVARARMQMRTAPVLQYRQGLGYDWEDVPTVVIPHPSSYI